MKKFRLASLLIPMIILSSCGKDPYLGDYSFQMGQEKSTHFSFVMSLTNEDYLGTDSVKRGKRFNLTVDIDNGAKDGGDLDNTASTILDFVNGKNIPGYYSIGENTEKDKKRLSLGLGIEEVIATIFSGLEEEFDISEITSEFNIDYDLTEKIIFSEIDQKSIYLTVPVSIDDFLFQLYWYGYDFQYDTENNDFKMVEMEENAHTPGTHPNKEDIAAINQTYPANHINNGTSVQYRDFHALTLGLSKK